MARFIYCFRLLAVLLWVLAFLILAGCDNTTPTPTPVPTATAAATSTPGVGDVSMNKSEPVAPGEKVALAVQVSGTSSVPVMYEWAASAGSITDGQGKSAIIYQAPTAPGLYNINVTVTVGTWTTTRTGTVNVVAPTPPVPPPSATAAPPTATAAPPPATTTPPPAPDATLTGTPPSETGDTAPTRPQFDFDEGTQGWLCETNAGSQACTNINAAGYEGRTVLAVSMNLIGGNTPNNQGELLTDLRKSLRGGTGQPLNLTDYLVTISVYASEGAAGEPARPTGFQVFVKDDNYRSEYGPWYNAEEKTWTTVTLHVSSTPPSSGHMDPDFDPTRVVIIGLKMAAGTGSAATYQKPIYVDTVDWAPAAPPAGVTATAPPPPLADIFAQAHDTGGDPFEFFGQSGSFTAPIVTTAEYHRSPPYGVHLTYDFPQREEYGGWGVKWDLSTQGHFDATDFTALTFWAKGVEGGETFQIGLKDTNNKEVKVESATVGVVKAGQWTQFTVPLLRFTGVQTNTILNMNFGFHHGHRAGSISIDDIAFTSEPPSQAPLPEIFPQAGDPQTGPAAETFVYPEQPPSGGLTWRYLDAANAPCSHSKPYGLRLKYELPSTEQGIWGVHWDNTPLASFNAAKFTTLAFWVRGTQGGEIFSVGLRDTQDNEVQLSSTTIAAVPGGGWVEFQVPLSRFRGVNPGAVKNVHFQFKPGNGTVSICVDDIAFK